MVGNQPFFSGRLFVGDNVAALYLLLNEETQNMARSAIRKCATTQRLNGADSQTIKTSIVRSLLLDMLLSSKLTLKSPLNSRVAFDETGFICLSVTPNRFISKLLEFALLQIDVAWLSFLSAVDLPHNETQSRKHVWVSCIFSTLQCIPAPITEVTHWWNVVLLMSAVGLSS